MNKKLQNFFLIASMLCLGSLGAWSQITSFPFIADFSSDEISPFTGAAVVKTTAAEDGKAIIANNGEAYATIDFAGSPYFIDNSDEVTVSFQMLNGWLGSGGGNKFALLNSEGIALASISYDNKTCNINEVVIGNELVKDFEAFNAQSSAGAKGANGFDNSKGQGYKLNTAETMYNVEVTIKINAFGGVSISMVGGKNNVDMSWSGTVGNAALNLDKMFITNASNNEDRATGYYDLKITNKSLVRYTNDFSDGVATWTTATSSRYDPVILEEDDNTYLSVD